MQHKINISFKKSNKYLYIHILYKNITILSIRTNKSKYAHSFPVLLELIKESGISTLFNKNNSIKEFHSFF